ncbi:MAG: hypothetical protein KBD64_02265 [Gammaproteobacteria bacterium]|nr:hypothetical protein [Gammaproteobacteria bacterium]
MLSIADCQKVIDSSEKIQQVIEVATRLRKAETVDKYKDYIIGLKSQLLHAKIYFTNLKRSLNPTQAASHGEILESKIAQCTALVGFLQKTLEEIAGRTRPIVESSEISRAKPT